MLLFKVSICHFRLQCNFCLVWCGFPSGSRWNKIPIWLGIPTQRQFHLRKSDRSCLCVPQRISNAGIAQHKVSSSDKSLHQGQVLQLKGQSVDFYFTLWVQTQRPVIFFNDPMTIKCANKEEVGLSAHSGHHKEDHSLCSRDVLQLAVPGVRTELENTAFRLFCSHCMEQPSEWSKNGEVRCVQMVFVHMFHVISCDFCDLNGTNLVK